MRNRFNHCVPVAKKAKEARNTSKLGRTATVTVAPVPDAPA